MRKLLALGLWFFLVMVPCLMGEERGSEFGIHPGIDLRDIRNKARSIRSEVSREKDEQNAVWIDLFMDMHACTEVPLEKLRAILVDYTNYPQHFKRYKETTVSRDERGIYQHITVSIGLMGFSYDTRYILLSDMVIDTSDTFVMTWTHAGDDGTIKNIQGNWYLRSVMVDGQPHTYVRYTSFSTAIRKFPLQGLVMNMFKDMEHADMFDQFIKAARNS